jgi:AcrR family transcriptional regulator
MASKIRNKIIDHAIICFACTGFSGCSTKEIAKRADVTEGSLFRLFGSKQQLFHESLERVLSKFPGRSRIAQTYVRFLVFAVLEDALRVNRVVAKHKKKLDGPPCITLTFCKKKFLLS